MAGTILILSTHDTNAARLSALLRDGYDAFLVELERRHPRRAVRLQEMDRQRARFAALSRREQAAVRQDAYQRYEQRMRNPRRYGWRLSHPRRHYLEEGAWGWRKSQRTYLLNADERRVLQHHWAVSQVARELDVPVGAIAQSICMRASHARHRGEQPQRPVHAPSAVYRVLTEDGQHNGEGGAA